MSETQLKGKLLTKKRASSTQGLPAGKEHLVGVTNTVTLSLHPNRVNSGSLWAAAKAVKAA